MKRKRSALDCSSPCTATKRHATQPLLPSPPGTDSSHGPHLTDEDLAVDFSPISRPEVVLDTYDPDFGARVFAAWENKQEIATRAQARRTWKYGAEIVALYSPGATPEAVKDHYEKTQQEEIRNWQEELTSEEEDEGVALPARNSHRAQEPRQDSVILRKPRRRSLSIARSLDKVLMRPLRTRRKSAPPIVTARHDEPEDAMRGRSIATTS